MRTIYTVISYITSRDGSMKVKTLEGYTFLLGIAQTFIDTHMGDYDILVYQGSSDYELYQQIYEEHGFFVDKDLDMTIRVWGSHDGRYHIVDTKENIETILSEISAFDEVMQSSVKSYINMYNFSECLKDGNFKTLLMYLSNIYLVDLIKWFDISGDYGYYTDMEYQEYPVDVIALLVICGYCNSIEETKGENTCEYN